MPILIYLLRLLLLLPAYYSHYTREKAVFSFPLPRLDLRVELVETLVTDMSYILTIITER
jgi:hypothetical protein